MRRGIIPCPTCPDHDSTDRRPPHPRRPAADPAGDPARGDPDQRARLERRLRRARRDHRGHRRRAIRGWWSSSARARFTTPAAALDYAQRLKPIADRLADSLIVVMRTYFEKPRTVGRLEGADQRSRSRRELPHQQGAAAGAAAAARRQRSRPADRIGVSRHPDPAAHRRPDVVGGDRRAHGGEPGASRARVGAVDAGRLQEQHRRQHADRRRRGADGALAALVSVGHQAGRLGDLPDRRQRRLPRHPARRHAHRPELRRRARRQGRRAASPPRACARA